MNRLEASPTTSSLTVSNSKFSSTINPMRVDAFQNQNDLGTATVAATTFAPAHYESGYAYPLLVWLHGDGHSERDLAEIMPHVSVRNHVAVAPRGFSELELAQAVDLDKSQQQGSTDFGDRFDTSYEPNPWESEESLYRWSDTPTANAEAEDRVFAAIELATERFNIHDRRIFLAGVGTGGTAALRIALANPTQFAGVATFDGGLPCGNQPLRLINRLRNNLPILLNAAEESPNYPPAQLCSDLRLLHSAGCSVQVQQHPDNDQLTTAMLEGLNRWMMQLVCG